jgi:hypothetical protein
MVLRIKGIDHDVPIEQAIAITRNVVDEFAAVVDGTVEVPSITREQACVFAYMTAPMLKRGFEEVNWYEKMKGGGNGVRG